MKRLVIFLDYESDYSDRVAKIKNDAKNEVDYYYIEEFESKKLKDKINKDDVIYFLTNVKEIRKVVNELPDNQILNKEYYLGNHSKEKIQLELLNNGVDTPRIIDYRKDFCNKDFPLYMKNKKHDVFVAKICSLRSFNYLFSLIDINDFYLEEEIKDIIKEHKIYYSNNAVFENDKDEISKKIIKICNIVAKVTGLDVYSADLIETNHKIYVVDVNPAPGFWNSKESRLKLLEYCE